MTQKEFEPSVRGGFETDNAYHVRNLHAIRNFLLERFVGSGQLAPGAVTGDAIADGAITDAAVGSVSVSKLTDGILSAVATLQGAIVSGNLRWDANGITLLDDAGAVMFSLASGSDPFIRAQIEAIGLLVEGGLVIRGTDNLMEPGSALILGGAGTGETVGNPAASPALKMEWETFPLEDQDAEFRLGLSYDATNTSWWSTSNRVPAAPTQKRVIENDNDASRTELRSFIVPGMLALYGAVRLGTRVFVLGRKAGNGHVLIRAYAESDLAFLGETDVDVEVDINIGGDINGVPALGTDGTNLFIVDVKPAGGINVPRFHQFSPSNGPDYVSTTQGSGSIPSLEATVRGFVAAESSWWIAVGGSRNRVHAWSTAGVSQLNKDFPNGEGVFGLTHDGTRFWSLGAETTIKHTNWIWTTESSKYWVAFTYVDDNGSASVGARPLGAGDFETERSPAGSITMSRRARLRRTAAPAPAGSTVSHVGFYMERGSTLPTLDFREDVAIAAGLATTSIIEDFTTDASPEAPPGTNTFPGGSSNFAELRAADGSVVLRGNGIPRCKLRYAGVGNLATGADRYVRFGTEDTDTDGFHPSTTDAIAASPDSSYDITLPFTGQYLVIFRAVFEPGTGQRHFFWQINGAGGERHKEMAVSGSEAHASEYVFVVDGTAGNTLRFGVLQSAGVVITLNSAGLYIEYKGKS